jgi:hypothetical protein
MTVVLHFGRIPGIDPATREDRSRSWCRQTDLSRVDREASGWGAC